MRLIPALRRARGTVGTALTWAGAWGLGGIGVGLASRLLPVLPWAWFLDVFDAPLPALAVPGAVAGACYAALLRVAGHGTSLSTLTARRAAGLGALAGVGVSLVPALLTMLGLATPTDGARSLASATLVVIGPFMLMGAGSAVLTLRLARLGGGGTGHALAAPRTAP